MSPRASHPRPVGCCFVSAEVEEQNAARRFARASLADLGDADAPGALVVVYSPNRTGSGYAAAGRPDDALEVAYVTRNVLAAAPDETSALLARSAAFAPPQHRVGCEPPALADSPPPPPSPVYSGVVDEAQSGCETRRIYL